MSREREVFSKNLEYFIEKRGIDQKILSDHLGISEMSVSNWVNGNKYPRMGNVQKIADYFGIKKSDLIEDKTERTTKISSGYAYLPTAISAGLPFNVDGVTNADKIDIPDSLMGKYAGNKSIVFSRICGDSMDKVISDGSLIAIKSVPLESLKNGDMVVFSTNYDYSVKYFYKTADKLIFKPASTNEAHHEQHYDLDANIQIHGKVVLYIVELD